MYIIFLERLGSYIFKIIDIILIWAVYPRCPKCLYYLIRDLLASSLDVVMIASNIISFKLGFISNAGVFINISYFYIIKNIVYPIWLLVSNIIYIILNWKKSFSIRGAYLIILLFTIYYMI